MYIITLDALPVLVTMGATLLQQLIYKILVVTYKYNYTIFKNCFNFYSTLRFVEYCSNLAGRCRTFLSYIWAVSFFFLFFQSD